MIINNLYVDTEYYSFGLTDEILQGPYLLKTETIKISDWPPIAVWLSSNGQLGMGDFMSIAGLTGCNQRARELLEKFYPQEVDFLPITFEAQNYYVVRVLKTIDCLDTNSSTFEYFPSGNIRRITKYVFMPETLVHYSIFHIPQRPVFPLFVTGKFRDFVEKYQLKGLEFTKLWEG